jgi:CheY-like chemotaxis protein
VSLLVIDDSDEDFYALKRALGVNFPWPVARCADGASARATLVERSAPDVGPLPRLILLDLNMPGLDGWRVLRELKRCPETQCIPVVIWSTSSNPDAIKEAHRAGASSYIVKPLELDELRRKIEGLARYWLEIVALPRQ